MLVSAETHRESCLVPLNIIDPMPSIHLHNTLAEFVPQFPADLLPEGSNLGKIVAFPSSETGSSGTEGEVKLGVDVRWVMSVSVLQSRCQLAKD